MKKLPKQGETRCSAGRTIMTYLLGERRENIWRIWIILVPFICVSIAATIEHYQSEKEHNEQITQQLQSIASKVTATGYSLVTQNLEGAAKQPFISRTARGEESPDNSQALAAMTTVASVTQSTSYVDLLNNEGTVVACTPYGDNKTLTGNNYAFRPYFTKVIDSGKPTLYMALGVTTGKRGIYVSVPVNDGNGMAGVLVSKQSLTGIDHELTSQPFPTTLVSTEGVIFASSNKEWLFKTVFPMSDTQRKANRRLRYSACGAG